MENPIAKLVLSRGFSQPFHPIPMCRDDHAPVFRPLTQRAATARSKLGHSPGGGEGGNTKEGDRKVPEEVWTEHFFADRSLGYRYLGYFGWDPLIVT